MHRTRTQLAVVAACALAAWSLAGCSQSTDTDSANDISSRTQTIDLNDNYGGFNTANEKPAFGDRYLSDNYGSDNNAAALGDPADDHMRRHRYLLVTWGNLENDSTVDFSTDWSGSLCVENGVVRALRTVRFEYPQDHLTERTSRTCVGWVSHTRPDFDGVLFALNRMPCDSLASADSLCGEPLKVTFTTGPLTVTITQEELTNLHRVVKVDDAGNAVAFNSIVLEPHACPNGFLAGQWKNVPDQRYDGILRGEWMSENGLHKGFLRGVYGQNRRHENVFFAKWITDDGSFHGLMKGLYGRNPAATDETRDGWFNGIWVSRELRIVGNVRGVWDEGNDSEQGGFFRGAWSALCRP